MTRERADVRFGSFASDPGAAVLRAMSAMPPIATELMRRGETTRCATCGLMHRSKRSTLAPPYSTTSSAVASSVGGTFETKDAGGRNVDHKVELGRLHDRQVGWLRAFEDTADVNAGLMMRLWQARPITHQPADFRITTY